jgi:hypothetical protein
MRSLIVGLGALVGVGIAGGVWTSCALTLAHLPATSPTLAVAAHGCRSAENVVAAALTRAAAHLKVRL